MEPVVDIADLVVGRSAGFAVLDGIGLAVQAGEIVAVVGPSGVGKTTLLRALIADAAPGMAISASRLRVCGHDVLAATPQRLRALRRELVGYVGQDPARRLNPRMRVRRLLAETSVDPSPDAPARLLSELSLPAELLRRRPGQLSGGQQRRVAIARALARRPALLLLDEPSAGLDESLRDELAGLLRHLAGHGMAIVMACHDPDLVDRICDHVLTLGTPSSTRPAPLPALAPLPTRHEPPILVGRGLSAWFGRQPVLTQVDLRLNTGSATAVVGPSGSGKTTLARLIVGLHTAASGTVELDEVPLHRRAERRSREQRRRVQLVPQDPLGSLNPRRTIRAALTRPVQLHHRCPAAEHPHRVHELLTAVGLPAELADRYPDALSGGQRQRVAIARALAAEPDVLVCDEITSALDPHTAEAVMMLLSRLRQERGLALLVISHDLDLVTAHADHVLALRHGHTVAAGPTSVALAALRPADTATPTGRTRSPEHHPGHPSRGAPRAG